MLIARELNIEVEDDEKDRDAPVYLHPFDLHLKYNPHAVRSFVCIRADNIKKGVPQCIVFVGMRTTRVTFDYLVTE